MKARDIPNLISIMRILLVIPIVVLLLQQSFAMVIMLFALAGASDGLDGYLARRFNWRSRLGAILDPLADKLLMFSSYVALGWMGLLPLWLVLLVVARDVVIVAGAFAYHRLCGGVEMAPTRLSKTNTLFQIVLVLLVLIAPLGLTLPPWGMNSVIAIVALTTALSGGNYVWEWSRRARRCRERGERE